MSGIHPLPVVTLRGRGPLPQFRWYIFMAVIIERDGIRYRRTSMEVREDLHAYAREHGVNMSALLNKSLEDKRRGKR